MWMTADSTEYMKVPMSCISIFKNKPNHSLNVIQTAIPLEFEVSAVTVTGK